MLAFTPPLCGPVFFRGSKNAEEKQTSLLALITSQGAESIQVVDQIGETTDKQPQILCFVSILLIKCQRRN